MVPQNELNVAADVTRVEWQSWGTYSGANFHEFEARLCHTPRTEVTTNFNQNYGGNTPVLVASADPYVINTTPDKWFGIDCSPAFPYNNQDSLIIEVRWRNQQLGVGVDVWSYVAGANVLLIAKDYNATEGTVGTKVNRFRITFSGAGVAPTSLGRVRALFR